MFADQSLKYHIKTTYTIGQDKAVLGDWFHLNFVENPGMAFGFEFGGESGKLILSVFRIIASILILVYLISLIRKGEKNILIFLVSLVFAGAVGNIIDSLIYGKLFTESTRFSVASYDPANGYAGFFYGKVVDMLYFPLIEGHYPDWFPRYHGRTFIFFRPVFNIADTAISLGVFSIILFQRRIFS